MVQRLVRLHLGYSAQSGPLCERKTNVGGSNEKGALEGGVATEGSHPAIEDLSRAKPVCFVLFFFSLCLCAQCEFCTSTSKQYPGWEAAALVRKRRDDYFQDGVALHSTEHTLPLSPFMQKILEMASGARSSKLELKGPWPCSLATLLRCSVLRGPCAWAGEGTGFWLQCWLLDQQIWVVP